MSWTPVGCWDIPNDNADKGLDGIGNPGYLLKSFNFAIDPRRSFSCFFYQQKILLCLPCWSQEWGIKPHKMVLEHQNGGFHPR